MIRRTLMLSLALCLISPSGARAQDVADQLRAAMKSEVFNLEMLFRTDAEVRLEDGAERSAVDVAVARLRAGGRLDGGFRYFAQLEFARDPNLLDLRLGWSPGPEFLVRAGYFKTPFSREFLTFYGARDFNGTSRVVGQMAPNRQYGIELSGRATEHVHWQVGGFTGADADSPIAGELLAGRVTFDKLFASDSGSGLSFGVNGAIGTDRAIAPRVLDSDLAGDGTLVGVDARYERGPLLLAGEWIAGDFESGLIPPDDGGGVILLLFNDDASGMQLTGGWQFTDVVQGLVRWDHFDGPEVDADDLMLLGLNITPTAYVRIQGVYRAPLQDASESHRIFANIQLHF